MKRYILFLSVGSLAVFVLLLGIYAIVSSRGATDPRIFRGRSLLDTENYLSAAEVLREATTRDNNGPQAHAYLGAAYLRLHLYQAAIREFQEAVRQRSRLLDGWLGLAAAYLQLGDADKALEPVMKAASIDGKSTDAWIMLGRAHWIQRSFGEAEKAALKAQEFDPGNPMAAELLLHLYFDQNQTVKFQALLDRQEKPGEAVRDLAVRFFARQGQFVRAAEYRSRYEKPVLEHNVLEGELALRREPERAELLPALVRDLLALGRPQEAVAAAARYRGPVALDLELGKAGLLLGRNDDAIRYFQRASGGRLHKLSAEIAMATVTGDRRHWQEAFRAERIEKDYFVFSRLEDALKTASPIEKAFIYRYAGIYDPYFYNKTAEAALAVLNQEPGDYDALMTIATAYQRLGRIDESTRYVERARMTFPSRAEPWQRLGNLASVQGNAKMAMEYMEKAVQLDPSDPGSLFNVGWINGQLGDTARASAYYERAIAASPLSFEAMNNLALIYQTSGRADRAKELLDRAARVDPENEAVYLNLADYYVRQQSWKEAMENYGRALAANPSNALASIEMGRIHLDQGETEQALEKLNQALDTDPNAFDAYTVLAATYEKLGRSKEAAAALEEAKRIRPGAPGPGKDSK